MYHGIKTALTIAGISLGAWLTVRLFLPILFPFLLGGALALGAEPVTVLLCARLKLPRGAAAGIGVTTAFCLLILLVLLLCALILREFSLLMSILPALEQSLSGGLSALRDFFSGSSELLKQTFRFALGLTGGVLRRVPNGALILGTAVISSYMISARLPTIRTWLKHTIAGARVRSFLERTKQMKVVLLGWLKAQLKLMGLTGGILTAGLLLLRVPYAPLWAGAVALVDVFPVLGTGTVLLPWALISFLQKQTVRAVGLLGIYSVISLTRSVMEPKLLGSQLGLDPLATLAALYTGFRLWGFKGMLLAPLLAVTALQLLQKPNPGD